MESYADVGCVLKVNVHCEACKMKVCEVLRSISGVYSVTIDAEEGLAKISGEADPNILLSALGRSGRHAELKWVKLKSTAPNRAYYEDHGHSHGYQALEQPYGSRSRALPEGVWCDTHHSYCPRTVPKYPHHNSSDFPQLVPEYSRYGSSYGYPSPYGAHL
ncbi:Heavy metal-associated isoprenylated plant protein 32 [Camellia lanceoleosa]|uniref:Heavy metal-associated isoprenylated plant protein 32 n=1 Tax=Camellia lanceoleosa TaxID=1840588 RepID=A0ACC0HEQ6_9ERIC|nr:Heavy metal-associated isoprenylated plant protein 32 [Camellia lanceoleosa]